MPLRVLALAAPLLLLCSACGCPQLLASLPLASPHLLLPLPLAAPHLFTLPLGSVAPYTPSLAPHAREHGAHGAQKLGGIECSSSIALSRTDRAILLQDGTLLLDHLPNELRESRSSSGGLFLHAEFELAAESHDLRVGVLHPHRLLGSSRMNRFWMAPVSSTPACSRLEICSSLLLPPCSLCLPSLTHSHPPPSSIALLPGSLFLSCPLYPSLRPSSLAPSIPPPTILPSSICPPLYLTLPPARNDRPTARPPSTSPWRPRCC